MRSQRRMLTPKAPAAGRSVSESIEQQETRQARVAEVMAQARKHPAKVVLPSPEDERIVYLQCMLDNFRREHQASADAPERASHLTNAIRDLETLIARLTTPE